MGTVLPFEAVGIDAVSQVGGKNASLGELIRALRPKGVNIPNGFAITAEPSDSLFAPPGSSRSYASCSPTSARYRMQSCFGAAS